VLVSEHNHPQEQVIFLMWLHAPPDVANINTHGIPGLGICWHRTQTHSGYNPAVNSWF